MAIVQSTRYDCFARFTSGITYAVGTNYELRSGVWHEPFLQMDVKVLQRFMHGAVTDARQLDLVIADQALGTFQTLVAAGGLDGIAVTLECVSTSTLNDQDDPTETQTKTTVMNIHGSRLEPGKAIITLRDMEDTKLTALYPSVLWQATDFRDIAQADAGVAIAHPIGTARKLKAALLSSDTTNNYYYYGVCNAPLLTLPIAAISTGSKTFSVAGDYTDRISAGSVVYSSTSSANAGRYTVTGAVYSAPNTVVTVSEVIGSGTVSGNLLVPPTVLAVYRDGRLVASTEYTVELLWPITTQHLDSDFDNSPADWLPTTNGTGTATVTSGVGRLVGDGTTTNWARLIASDSPVEAQRGAFYAATITLATAGKVRLFNNSATADGTAVVSGLGTHTALVRQNSAGGIRRIDVSNYNSGYSGTVDVDNLVLNTTHRLLLLRFVREQVAFDGSAHIIEVDVRGVESRNAAAEISRLLTVAGVTPDASTFATATTYATTHRMLVDCDHGTLAVGDKGQRVLRAIVDDLLFIARASLYRTSAGAYGITQDKTGTSAATYSEAQGDRVAVAQWRNPPRPASVAISYLPNVVDPRATTHTITRAVTGGVLGAEKPREVRYLSDHEAADRLLCYLALRAEFSRECKLKLWLAAHSVGDVVSVVSPVVGIHSAQPLWIQAATQMPAGIEVDAVEYHANVHTYSAGTLPADAATGYQPDYSKTAPATPTALTITAATTGLALDGALVGRLGATAVAPTVNFAELWFWCVHNTTGEITGLCRGELSGSTYAVTLTGLRPGEVYQLKCDAVNSYGIHSAVPATFNATAIGGSGTATTFTAPGYATAPATVGSCSASQGMGRLIRVAWAGVTTANLSKYSLEKKVGAGAFAEVATPLTTVFTDTDVAIGTAYQYRVRALDSYGNYSAAYATSGSVTPTSNIVGGSSGADIGGGTVDTTNRSAATGVSVTYNSTDVLAMSSGGVVGKTATHSLGKLPVVGACVYAGGGVLSLSPRDPTSSDIDIVAFGHPIDPTDSASGAGAHQHGISFSTVADGDTATIYVW